MTAATALGLVALLLAKPLSAAGDGMYLAVLLVGAVLVPAGVALATFTRQQRKRLVIEVLPDRVHLPTSGPARLAVRYRDIRALFLQRRGLGGFFYISTPDRELIFPLRAFPADEAERLFEAIRTRIARVGPEGERRLAAIERMGRVAERAFSRAPVVTWATVAVMAAIHLYFLATDQLVGVLDVASLGAVSPELVDASGPFLAFTNHWVHGWRFQPLLILPGLFVVGTLVERLLGHGVAALSILGSATLGGLAAAYFPGAPLHAGGLIPAAGLVGTLAFTAQRYRSRMPIGFRLGGQWWAWMATLAAVAALVHGLSVPGALIGLLTGVVIAALVTDRDPEIPLSTSPRWSALAAALLIALHATAAVFALFELPGRGLELERVAVENLSDARRLNEYAWQLAVAEERPADERLELALDAADRAIGLEAHGLLRLAYRDTHATVLYRLGRYEAAIAEEREVLEERPESLTSATQLARFLDARLEKDGPLGTSSAPLEGVEVTLELSASSTAPGEASGQGPPGRGGRDESGSSTPNAPRYEARISTPVPASEPHVIYAPVRATSGEGLGALVRLPLPAGARTATVSLALVGARSAMPELGRARPAYAVPGRASGKIWAMNPTFLDLP